MRFDFVTIFPSMFEPQLAEGIIGRGVKQGLLEARVWDLRDFASDKHRSTDDEAYGGGPGMVMLAEPVLRCVEAIHKENFEFRIANEELRIPQTANPSFEIRNSKFEIRPHLVLTTPQGRRLDQTVAKELRERQWLVFLCGRYEGFDHRVHELLQPDEISIGDFVVSGGELPALCVVEAAVRLIPGVLGHEESARRDSFSDDELHGSERLLDHPHYTRPRVWRGRATPEVLLSGNHEQIARWRAAAALAKTRATRPDLIKTPDAPKANLETEPERARRNAHESDRAS